MLRFIQTFVTETWQLVAEMAPYLLFGFAIAGLLSKLIQPKAVQRLLGKKGIKSVTTASVIGVPMPLCSCSVIPVAASLRASGATRGATASFLSSTPQTGVDSILATYALLGGAFTIIRVIVAFICGVTIGLLTDLFCKDSKQKLSANTKESCSLSPHAERDEKLLTSTPPVFADLRFSAQKSAQSNDKATYCQQSLSSKSKIGEALRYGFIKLPSDLGSALILGFLIAGLISASLPENLLSGHLSQGPLSFLLATLVSLPLYVCATASIPMAYAFIAAGLSPGAALVFLITGPATNTATITSMWTMLGQKATVIYLGCLLVISWVAGWLFNAFLQTDLLKNSTHHHEVADITLWQHGAGIVLCGFLIGGIVFKHTSAKVKKCCATL